MDYFSLLPASVILTVSSNNNDGNDGDKPLSFEKRQPCFYIQHDDSIEVKHFPHVQMVCYGQSLFCYFSCLVINGVLTLAFFIREEVSKYNQGYLLECRNLDT